MASKTEQFKSAGSDLGRTIGQSWSMITGKDIPNYSLLFLDDTATKKRGDHETIFMPHIVLGRSARCHIRYGEEFRTVSREHASITVEGNHFVINHNPAASNPTYVNGRTIGAAYHLQNGDEIQLSSNGPKLRFNTTSLKTSTLGITNRIGQAMSQAAKPYKKALWVMGLLLLGALGLAGYNMYKSGQLEKELIALKEEKSKIDQEISDLVSKGKENSAAMEELKKRKDQIVYRINTIVKEIEKQEPEARADDNQQSNTPGKTEESIKPAPTFDCDNGKDVANSLPKNDVVVIIGKRIEISFKGVSGEIGEKEYYQFGTLSQLENRNGLYLGTGFLTTGGLLLTCRHVVQPWRYYRTTGASSEFWKQINLIETNGGTVTMHFDVLRSDGTKYMNFTSASCIKDDSGDVTKDNGKKKVEIDVFGKKSKIKIPNLIDKTKEMGENFSDWANIPAEMKGEIVLNKTKSTKLPQGEKLWVLGYSHGWSLTDSNRRPQASLSETSVANTDEINGTIYISGQNFGPGNSGGPAFICENGQLSCVGIVSMAVGTSNGILIPVQRVRGIN